MEGATGPSPQSNPNADTTPNPFTFVDQTNVPRYSVRTFNAVTVTGINAPAPISVLGDGYLIGCHSSVICLQKRIRYPA